MIDFDVSKLLGKGVFMKSLQSSHFIENWSSLCKMK